jgi:hypothetical protein
LKNVTEGVVEAGNMDSQEISTGFVDYGEDFFKYLPSNLFHTSANEPVKYIASYSAII